MSRASAERDEALNLMCEAVMNKVFSQSEVERMLMEALHRMTRTEMENLVRDNTRFEDLLDVDVAM